MKNLFTLKPDSCWHPDNYPDAIKQHVLWPVKLFLFSLASGSAILLLYLLTHSDFLVMIGLWYLIAAVAVNTLAFISLIIMAAIHYRYAGTLLSRAIVLTLNIPIAFLYFNIVVH